MQKEDIVLALEKRHKSLLSWLADQDNDKWEIGPAGKWTMGQQALHLLQSISTLNTALSIPKFILKYKYGKANREVRDYEAVVKRYHERLKEVNGATFGPSKNMRIPKLRDKYYLIDRIQTENKKLQYKTNKWTDEQLDTYVLPHPLMGKMPVREVIMWTTYHIEHHTKTLMETY